jgi:excisionase family DNA binding protein
MLLIAARAHLRPGLWAIGSLFCLLVVTNEAAAGQTPPPCESTVLTLGEAANLLRVDAAEIEQLAEQHKLPARRIGSSWRFNCAALMAWLNGEWELIGSLLTARDMSEVTATGTARDQGEKPPSAKATSPADGQNAPIGEAPEEREAEDVFLRGQRVLLGRGDVVVDFGEFYSRSGDHLLASLGSGIALATVERQALTSLVVGRVGILDETELFASTTFSSQHVHQFFGATSLARSGRSELGVASVGVRRTLLRERAGRPDIIVSLDGQIPTGRTSSAVGGGLTFVKSVDPVVLFASANYLRTFGRVESSVAGSQPKSGVDVSLGYGLALNDTLAISAAVSGVFAGATTLDNAKLRRPGSFGARLGLTSWLAKGLYIEPSVSFGLTGPGDSFALGVTMPYAF